MDFANPHFAEPHWLTLGLLGALCLIALHRYAARARRKQLSLVVQDISHAALLRSHSPSRRMLKNTLLAAVMVGLGITLARPQWGEQKEETVLVGEDLLFVLDCSKSMLAEDVRPNRLARAKYSIMDFVQRHSLGRVGLVAFAGQAFLQCPLTLDYDAFRESLQAIDGRTIPVPGTDIGRAIDEALLAAEKLDRHKIIVLVTDGEDLENSGIKTAQSLSKQGIQIFAIGVGNPSGTTIPVMTETGQMAVQRDTSGEVVQSRLDEKTLKTIARATGGLYAPLGPTGEGMTRVRQAIEFANASGTNVTSRKRGVDRFHFPLAAVLLLLVTESLIGTRRKNTPDRGIA